MVRGRIDFADQSRRLKPEKALSPIDFHSKDLRTTAEGGGVKLTAVNERNEGFEWDGQLSLQPFSSTGKLGLVGLKAETIQAFIGDELPFVLSAGSVDLGADYVFSAAKNTDMQLEVSLPKIIATAFGLRARGVEVDWFGLPSVVLNNTKVSWGRRQVEVGAVRVDGMQAKV